MFSFANLYHLSALLSLSVVAFEHCHLSALPSLNTAMSEQEQVEESKRQVVTFSLFLEKPTLRTLIVAFGLMLAQQFSGINAVIFYAETIFMQTGVKMNPLVQMLIFAVVQVISCTAAAALIDKVVTGAI